MSIFNKNKGGGRKKPTTGFSELNRRTYEASQTGRTGKVDPSNTFGYAGNPNVEQKSAPRRPESAGDYTRRGQQQRYAQARKQNDKKRRRKKALIIAGSILGGLIVIAAIVFGIISCRLNAGMGNIGLTPTSLDKPFYMVLMGVDSSDERKAQSGGDDGDYRSDSIILARIAADEKKVTLMSLHRDIEIDMGEYGTQKLNAAHSLGGPELVIKTVSKLAGVDINHYAEINFDGFKTAVNSLGGVDVNVPIEINDELAGGHVPAGQQHLDGDQALILCRARHAFDAYGDGDKYRAANQRVVLSAIAQKALSSDILTIAQTVTDLSEYIKTDLGLNDMIGLAQLMMDINPDKDVYTAMTPTEGVYHDGGWYEELDTDKWKEMMKRMDKGLPPEEETYIDPATGTIMSSAGRGDWEGKVVVWNGSGVTGAAAKAAGRIVALGFTAETGNADSSDFSRTLIIYKDEDKEDAAEAIADKLGCGKVQEDNGKYNFDGDILVIIGLDFD